MKKLKTPKVSSWRHGKPRKELKLWFSKMVRGLCPGTNAGYLVRTREAWKELGWYGICAQFNLQISWRLKCQCKETVMSGMVGYACDSNTGVPMAEGLTWVWSQLELQREHPANYNRRVRPCLRKKRERGGPSPWMLCILVCFLHLWNPQRRWQSRKGKAGLPNTHITSGNAGQYPD